MTYNEFYDWVYDNLTPYHTQLIIKKEFQVPEAFEYGLQMWDIMKCGVREWIPGILEDGSTETTLTIELPGVGSVTFKLEDV